MIAYYCLLIYLRLKLYNKEVGDLLKLFRNLTQ